MGEAKRRKQLDPNWGKPVQTRVELSSLTGKWLCVAYILGQRTVISPHYNRVSAESAAAQVEARFNTIQISEWRRYINGDTEPFSKALSMLDYDDDDEIVGIGHLNPDGSLSVQTDLDARQKFTEDVNEQLKQKGLPAPFFFDPQLYPQQEANP